MAKEQHDCYKDNDWGPWVEGSKSGIKALAALVGVDSSGKGRFRKCNICGNQDVE